MYAQLWKTRLTNVPSLWVLIGLALWVLSLVVLRMAGVTGMNVLGFVVVSVLLPTQLIGENKQYTALGLSRKQGFISELMIVVPIGLLAAVLFLPGSSAWTWIGCIAVFLAFLPVHYWGIADRAADQKVMQFFNGTTTVNSDSRGTSSGYLATPAAQHVWIPSFKATIILTVLITVALLFGSFGDVFEDGLTSPAFWLAYIGVFTASMLIPGMVVMRGGAGAWQAFGLPRKQFLIHATTATFLGNVVIGNVALLIATVFNYELVQESLTKFVLAWITWSVVSVAYVPLAARMPRGSNIILLMFVIFFLSTFLNVEDQYVWAVVGPVALAVCIPMVLIGAWSFWSIWTGSHGTRLVIPDSGLKKSMSS